MKEFLIELFPNVYEMFGDLLDSIWQTFVMVGIAGIFGITIGTLLGIALVVSAKGGLYENDLFNNILGKIVNTIRSIPFVILIALMVSFTRFLVGTSIGVRGAIVPMVAGIIPLVTRMTEQALLEVDPGVMEAARSMGISRPYIIVHILLQESLPGLLRSLVTSFISLIGLSAMAGSVGGGGIGNFAIRYGYSRYMNDITVVTVLLLLLIVNIVQSVGNRAAQRLTH
ncbi:methionine ABC transporter permease [Faecalispora jeddahensis]|uniref:methionine ABC transporter permease n=1 Tax=Faecalispora jeddahensis TaxID=1414721 RepID=UPI00189C4F08|nr:methionine ABC transporter permease [Faecalispora jeddahensis]MDU6305787.1 methionine ABC transporter permease [Clostridium sp.]MDU6345431.1 methionine ABC transporter permease [Clostridium sp.]